MLIHGAPAVLRTAEAKDKKDPFSRWAREVAKRRGHHKAILAIANKMARVGWVVLAKDLHYDPQLYTYRARRSVNDAVNRVNSLLNTGHHEVVDAGLSNYFGEIPHAELMKNIAHRVSGGRMLGLVKSWLVMPVEEDDGKCGKRRTNRAKKERKGTPPGCPISPLLSNIYMRRFILGWKQLGYAWRFHAEIVNYADDIYILGKVSATEMLLAVNRIMVHLKLPVNAGKTRCLRCPEEPLEFLGYRIGTNYRHDEGGAYIGT